MPTVITAEVDRSMSISQAEAVCAANVKEMRATSWPGALSGRLLGIHGAETRF